MTDIRVGDLVKATSTDYPEDVSTFRVKVIAKNPTGYYSHGSYYSASEYTFEVLDRPAPPIDEELLLGAVDAFRIAQGFVTPKTGPDHTAESAYGKPVKAVINFVREYDRRAAAS